MVDESLYRGEPSLASSGYAFHKSKFRTTMAKKRKPELEWQRGYRCHTLWRQNERLGKISLTSADTDRPCYLCEVGTVQGETDNLAAAKKWVLRQAKIREVQLPLF